MGNEAFFAFLKDYAGQMAGRQCYTPSDALHYKTHVSIYVQYPFIPFQGTGGTGWLGCQPLSGVSCICFERS